MRRFDLTDAATIAALTDMLTTAGVDGLEITTPDTQLRLVISVPGNTAKASSVAATFSKPKVSCVTVKAPLAGHFYLSHPSVVAETDKLPCTVAADDVVGFIRISHILVPVQAGCAGSLTRQLASQDALVGYGDPLFELELQS